MEDGFGSESSGVCRANPGTGPLERENGNRRLGYRENAWLPNETRDTSGLVVCGRLYATRGTGRQTERFFSVMERCTSIYCTAAAQVIEHRSDRDSIYRHRQQQQQQQQSYCPSGRGVKYRMDQ